MELNQLARLVDNIEVGAGLYVAGDGAGAGRTHDRDQPAPAVCNAPEAIKFHHRPVSSVSKFTLDKPATPGA